MQSDKYIKIKPEELKESNFTINVIKQEVLISIMALIFSIFAFILSLYTFLGSFAKDTKKPVIEENKSSQILVAQHDIRGEVIEIKAKLAEARAAEERLNKPEVIMEPVKYFDVPLSTDLQDHIFSVCEKRNIDPAIIVAMIERESDYRPSTIGDGGNSLGLMQIQPKWHQERANQLGCSNLMDPYQNITVGVDLFSDLLKCRNSVEWALMAYNGGPSYANNKARNGVITDYARAVLNNSKNLEKGRI